MNNTPTQKGEGEMSDTGYTKICSRCRIEKTLNLFWKNAIRKDGRDQYCSDCRKKYYGRIASGYKQKRWVEKNKHKAKAYGVVARLKKSGELKQEPCFFCQEKETEAHHMLYEFPDKVVWLCPKHHSQVHLEGKINDEQ